MKTYILDEDKRPVEVDYLTSTKWLGKAGNRIIDRTDMPRGVFVSTVFLGFNHAWDGGPPVLFETMIFGGWEDEYQERYCTVEEAREGHRRAVQKVRLHTGLS